MSDCFTLDGGYIAAEVQIHSNATYGTGRAELPVLVFSLELTLRGPKRPGRCYDFRELRCRLSPFDTVYLATSLPSHLDVRMPSGKEVSGRLTHLEVPMGRTHLAVMNRLRKGGDVVLRLDLELSVDELVEIGQAKDALRPSIWGFAERYRPRLRVQVTIPRSTWVEKVLDPTEFGKTYLIELPVIPVETCAKMKTSSDALQQAVKLESMGFYNEAVAQCRIALEPFFEIVQAPDGKGGTKQRRALKAAWQTRLAQQAYDWLNGSFLAVSQATNQPHHPASSNFDQMEAQMLLMITTALVSYAIKTQPPAPSS
jgi:hypothetical protein